MNLYDLTPSVARLKAQEPVPPGTPEPTKRLTVLLGAGASLYAKAPSTHLLTEELAAKRPVCGMILERLRSEFPDESPNFEDILYVLEELDGYRSRFPSQTSKYMSSFVELRHEIAETVSSQQLVEERLLVIEFIADQFKNIKYDQSWRPLYDALRPFLEEYNLDIFTLNYDLLADCAANALACLSGKKYFDGFGSVRSPGNGSVFRSDEYAITFANTNIRLAHIHGSLAFTYHQGRRPFAYSDEQELVEADSLEIARRDWRLFTEKVALKSEILKAWKAPIISGRRKLDKINARPFANYYHAFVQAVSTSPYLLIVGYGVGDEHINYWLKEASWIHGKNQRVVEVTTFIKPEQFISQRFAAYELGWERATPETYTSKAGAHYLVYTKGLQAYESLPGDQFRSFLNADF